MLRRTPWILPLLLLLFLSGCATPPPEPVPAPLPPPDPEPLPEPEPEPQGTAPLVGTLWQLEGQYGEEEIPSPSAGTVTFFLSPEEGSRLVIEGPTNQMYADFSYRIRESKSDAFDYEEGAILFRELASTRRAGPYLRYETLMQENLALAQGYYISGETPSESRLVIFGGFGREEIILFELSVTEE